MRQFAWLHTAPTPPPSNKRLSNPQQQAQPMTRLQQLKADNMVPDMPKAGPAHYMVGYLFEAGPYGAGGGMAPAPLGWGDIAQWQRATGTPLQPWEARTLRRLSCEYINTRQEAADPACPAPYLAAPDTKRRAAVEAKLRSAMAGRAASARGTQGGLAVRR